MQKINYTFNRKSFTTLSKTYKFIHPSPLNGFSLYSHVLCSIFIYDLLCLLLSPIQRFTFSIKTIDLVPVFDTIILVFTMMFSQDRRNRLNDTIERCCYCLLHLIYCSIFSVFFNTTSSFERYV